MSINHSSSGRIRIGFHKATNSLDVQWYKPLAFGYLSSYFTTHSAIPAEFIQVPLIEDVDSIDILGISCTSQDYFTAIEAASKAKDLKPSIITVIGGHHITHLPQTMHNCFDIGVTGEGEVISDN